MSTTSRAFGLAPVTHRSGFQYQASDLRRGQISSGFAENIYFGQPIRKDATGVLTPIQNTTDDLIGAFGGCSYTPVGGRLALSRFWPANTVIQTGSQVFPNWEDDPNIVYHCQFDGSVTQTVIGATANFTNITANDGNGQSLATLGVATIGVGVGQFRITGLAPVPNNEWGDAFVIVSGTIGRHQYVGDKAGI